MISFRIALRTVLLAMIWSVCSVATATPGTEPSVVIQNGGTSTQSFASVTSNLTTGRWDILLTAGRLGSGPTTFTITGDSTTKIGEVVVRQRRTTRFDGVNCGVQAGASASIVIDGAGGQGVHSVMRVTRSNSILFVPGDCTPMTPPTTPTAGWNVDIDLINTIGDLGACSNPNDGCDVFPTAIDQIRSITVADIDGSVIGDIHLRTDQSASVLGLLDIAGSLTSNIHARTIGTLLVADRLGIDATKTDKVVVHATEGIGTITAGAIFATIWSGEMDDANGDPGTRKPIGLIRATGDASNCAEIWGSISLSTIGGTGSVVDPRIEIGEGLRGVISLTEPLVHPIWMGTSFGAGSQIRLPHQGLRSQLVFNRNATTTASWHATASIRLENPSDPEMPLLLTSANYSAIPANIAGVGFDGAAGLAPYRLHDAACFPPNGSLVFVTALSGPGGPGLDCVPATPYFDLRLYGPMTLSAASAHFKVQVYDAVQDIFVDAGIAMAGQLLQASSNRTARVALPSGHSLQPGSIYRIVPITGEVYCDEVIASEFNVDDFSYIFYAEDGCGLELLGGYDLNLDNTLCSGDIAEWLSNPRDLNGDGVADSDDCAQLLQAVTLYDSVAR